MINFIQGTVKENNLDYQVLAVSENFWLSISVPLNCRQTVGKFVGLHTYMHWSQENGPTLFGFSSSETKLVFCLLIECNGIGPKAALSILNQIESQDLIKAIFEKDSKRLSQLNGIGQKKSEQIILSLSSKVIKLINDKVLNLSSISKSYFSDLNLVLVSLSYSRLEIDDSLEYLRNLENPPQVFDEALRKALSFLTKSK